MAASAGTSFIQYEFCNLCKVNHKRRKKHIYSKHHQTILQNILKKFCSKIEIAKQDLFSPRVQEEGFEQGAKFWCYFCKDEFDKHEIVENCTVIGGGILIHIEMKSHLENMTQFFWDNLLDKKLKPKFILSMEDLHIYKKASFLAVKKWQKVKDKEREEIAVEISYTEKRRQLYRRMNSAQYQSSSSPSIGAGDQPNQTAGGCMTVSAHGPGLTCIIQNKKEDVDSEGVGNVHTGAMPPWLRPESPSNQSQEIGPSMMDWQKHLESERKAKLPKNRVGANFDRKESASQEWLPSFGRVWSKGRRLQSKMHFEKHWKAGNRSGESITREPTRTIGSRTLPEGSIFGTDTSGRMSGGVDRTVDQTLKSSQTYGPFQTSMGFTSSSDLSVGGGGHVPYKRQKVSLPRSEHTNSMNGQDQISSAGNQTDVWSNSVSGREPVAVVPYRRKKGSHDQSCDKRQMLIQTPVLGSFDT